MTDQEDIDARIQTYYQEMFDEHVRLTTRSAQGPLEFQRTQEIIREHVPVGRVLDVGGGAGIHARALAEAGYDVEMIDPVPRHVEQARAVGVRASAMPGEWAALIEDGRPGSGLRFLPVTSVSPRNCRQSWSLQA